MAVGRELFKLYGKIEMAGVSGTKKDLSAVEKQAKKVQRQINKLGRDVQRVGKILTKGLTLPLLAAGAASLKFIDDATDLNETIAKTGELFGESAKDIENWAETSATKIGQSKTQAMDAASTFAIFGKSAGLAGKDLVKFSTEFTELASDMSSFFNTSPEDAITAIGAALRGENEPIRRYGVLLDDATMRQKAFELGLVSTTKKALLPQTKVLAAQALIIEQTATAQGDFARTSAGLANQKRILAAQLKNVSATLGQLFLPAALRVAAIVSKMVQKVDLLITAWKKLDAGTKKTIKGFIVIAAALGPVVFAVGKMIAFSKILIPLLVALKTGTFGWSSAMAALSGSVMGITLVIGALVALGWVWYSQWETLSTQLKAVWFKIRLTFEKGANFIVQKLADAVIASIDILDKVAGFIPGFEEKLKGAKLAMLQFKAEMFRNLGKQQTLTNSINEQAKSTANLTDTIKKAIAAGKEALGLKDQEIQKTQMQIDAEKDLVKQREKEVGAARAFAYERLDFEKDIQDQIDELTLTDFEKLERERDKKLAAAEQMGADVLAVEKLYEMKIQDFKDQQRDAEKIKDEQAMRSRLRQTSTIGNRINNIMGAFANNRLKKIDLEEKKQLDMINNSRMSEENKQAAIQRVQEQTEKKRQKIERQRAVREKAAALFNIGINTASAIVEALPNVPLSIFVGGLGAAEAGVVAAAPLPFFDGGLVKGSEAGISATVGERNQDEMVFPLERGIDLFINGLMEKLDGLQFPSAAAIGAPALAGAPAGTVNLNIGTFIGDRRGLKELERKLDTIRIAENQRKGF